MQLSLLTVVAGHLVLTVPFVILIVAARLQGFDRNLEWAAADLGADAKRTLRYVILPLIWPAVLAGALISVTLSIDEFVVTFFTVGPQSTLPLYIYTQIKFGVTPEVNAIATVMLGATLGAARSRGHRPGGARPDAVARRRWRDARSGVRRRGPARDGGPTYARDHGARRRPRRGRGLRDLRLRPADAQRPTRPPGHSRHDPRARDGRADRGGGGGRHVGGGRDPRDHRSRPEMRQLRPVPRGAAGELPQRRRARRVSGRRTREPRAGPGGDGAPDLGRRAHRDRSPRGAALLRRERDAQGRCSPGPERADLRRRRDRVPVPRGVPSQRLRADHRRRAHTGACRCGEGDGRRRGRDPRPAAAGPATPGCPAAPMSSSMRSATSWGPRSRRPGWSGGSSCSA